METIIKPRKPWIAGLLTILTIGLGHIYSGEPKKGVLLYLLGFIGLAVFIPLYLYSQNISVFLAAIVIGIAYMAYCFIDVIKITKVKSIGYKLKKYNKWYIYLAIYFISSFVIDSAVQYEIKKDFVQAYKVPAGSMLPTIAIGDRILVNKFIYKNNTPTHGDVVILPFPKDPSIDYIKRVIAIEGDEIEIRNKKVFINGKDIDEPYIQFSSGKILDASSPRDNSELIAVPTGKAFVMGDNRDNSYDSRFWGFVDLNTIKGKVSQIYWSWNSETNSVRWGRIGNNIN